MNDEPRPSKVTVSGRDPELDTACSAPTAEKLADGQLKDHWTLPEEDRKKGWVRPYRRSYIHEKCGSLTRMPHACAETYAKDPTYYGSTFCCGCQNYYPVHQFTWDGSTERVGS